MESILSQQFTWTQFGNNILIIQKMNRSNIALVIDRGVNYLENTQFKTGEFPAYFGTDQMLKELTPDSTIFPTVIAAMSLQEVPHPKIESILKKIESFLLEEEKSTGVWKYWTKSHPSHHFIPLDADDTACVSSFLNSRGVLSVDNRDCFLANRHPENGLFFTWFIPRKSFFQQRQHVAFFFRFYQSPFTLYYFFKKTEAATQDIDTVVQANILYYLGEQPYSQPIIEHINRVILENKEQGCDKWYHSPFYLYYMVVKNMLKGIKFHVEIPEVILSRIKSQFDTGTGQIGENVLDTAIALSTLKMLKQNIKKESLQFILDTQLEDGSWPNYYFYYGGPQSNGPDWYSGWCSTCLTTAFCLEAITKN